MLLCMCPTIGWTPVHGLSSKITWDNFHITLDSNKEKHNKKKKNGWTEIGVK